MVGFRSFQITLPTGGSVVIDQNSITIYPSPADFEQTEGLCGFFSSLCTDDYRMRDGSTLAGTDTDCGGIDEATQSTFSKEWRYICICIFIKHFSNILGYVHSCILLYSYIKCIFRVNNSTDDSLYEGEISDGVPYGDYYFCSCQTIDGEPVTDCASGVAVDVCIDGDSDITDDAFDWCADASRRRRNTGVYGDNVEEPVEKPSWDSNYESPVRYKKLFFCAPYNYI